MIRRLGDNNFFFKTSYNSIYFLLTIIHLSVKVVYNWLSAHHTIQQNYLPIQYNIVNNSNTKKKK